MSMTPTEAQALEKALDEAFQSRIKPVFDRVLALLEASLSQNVQFRARIAELERPANTQLS